MKLFSQLLEMGAGFLETLLKRHPRFLDFEIFKEKQIPEELLLVLYFLEKQMVGLHCLNSKKCLTNLVGKRGHVLTLKGLTAI